MLTKSLLSSAVAFSVLVGCASTPSEPKDDFEIDDDDDDQSETTEDDSTEDPGTELCTAQNDIVPMDEIVDAIQNVGGSYIYDIARASDGTVYFISGMMAQSATIGRREPCGTIEREWLSASVPIEQIEISSDDKLYFVANGLTSPTGRLYRVDLADPTALPQQLTSQAGYKIESLSAGPNGRVFLSRNGTNGITLGYVGTDGAVKLPWNLGDGHALVAAKPDGSAFVYRKAASGSRYVGKMTVSATGTASATTTVIPAGGPLDYDISEMHADETGGVYVQRMYDNGTADTCRLHHAADLLSPRTQLADVPYAYHCATQFGIDAPTSAAVVTASSVNNTAQEMTAVMLPVAVMVP
jgi:hypothetical protein